MKKHITFLVLLVIFLCSSCPAPGQTYESINLINSTNWAKYFSGLLGYLYDSHGCLHFTPSDIYLLAKTLPSGIPLTIKAYGINKPPKEYEKAPLFNLSTNSAENVHYYTNIFKSYPTRLVLFPSTGQLFILINDQPYLQVRTRPGPSENYRMVLKIEKDEPIAWDFTSNTPTDPGDYIILGGIDHYLSNLYRQNTIVPFDGLIRKRGNYWSFQDEGNWFPLPQHIINDLRLPADERDYDYYNVVLDKSGKVTSARWGSNDFGKYALLWSKDGKNRYPELGYAEGLLQFEQTILVKDLAAIATSPGPDQIDNCIANNLNFTLYKKIYEFVASSGEVISNDLAPTACAYYKLFNDIKLTASDRQQLDPRAVAAFDNYRQHRLSRNPAGREKELGLYTYIKEYDLAFRKQAHWYEQIKLDWTFWAGLRALLRQDLAALNITSTDKRKALVENWLNDRLVFKLALP